MTPEMVKVTLKVLFVLFMFTLLIVQVAEWVDGLIEPYLQEKEVVLDGQTLLILLKEARYFPTKREEYAEKYSAYAYLFTGDFMDFVTPWAENAHEYYIQRED